jgi:Coenzyme PQQ synthesis protein D (PqqD)
VGPSAGFTPDTDIALRPSPEVISKRLDEATVLVHIPTNRIFELNETGTRVWELLGQGLDTNTIVGFLVEEFDVDTARASNEVNDLLIQLRTKDLLVR